MSFFITFEGIEGSGKTTQLRRLRDHLQSLGHQVVVTREPGGCAISDAIRTLLLDPQNHRMSAHTELLLYGAARSQHVRERIRPALAAGQVVLCDRFADATTVYQGDGRGLDRAQIDNINRFAADGLTPDLTLLLDHPAEEGLRRARERNQDGNLHGEGRFELEDLAFHERIRQGYLSLASGHQRFRVIDALGSEDLVGKRISAVVDRFLAGRKTA